MRDTFRSRISESTIDRTEFYLYRIRQHGPNRVRLQLRILQGRGDDLFGAQALRGERWSP
ncbi:MAG: hypothetical protein IPG11_10595 [Flavobacteriales bacterium]|nr:hypothetical protein [Flavobacteriales bacterium]MBK7101390.1 hypothetical protein [Flavobacteriales bacterium]MBK7481906.1 hypothetical protein [Flavobacteriales bacterium]MBK7618880.1 hypothetical protein [Flavobacteriales bacterium]